MVSDFSEAAPSSRQSSEKTVSKGTVTNKPVKNKSTQHSSISKNTKKNKVGSAKNSTQKKLSGHTDSSGLKAQHKNTHSKIQTLQASIHETEGNKTDIEAQLKASEKEILSVRQNLKKIQRQRAKAESILKGQQKEKATIEAHMMHEQKLLEEINRQRIEYISQKNRPDWSHADPTQRMRTQMLLEILARKSSESIARLEVQQKKLTSIVAQSQKTQLVIQRNLQKEQKEQSRLNKERRARQQAVVKLEKELTKKTLTLKKLQQDESRLEKLISRLEREELAVQERKNKSKNNIQGSPSPQNNQLKESKTNLANLNTDKKLLSVAKKLNLKKYPVDGKLVAHFGEQRSLENSKMGKWKGVVFSVAEEKPVKAIKPGKVVFSDYLRGYGNLIIIDHGKGYFSVYGNNSSLEKDIGDKVAEGDIVSRVGSKNSDLTVLYFELRHNGKPIDPAQWLNL